MATNPTDVKALVGLFSKATINQSKGKPNIRALCPLGHGDTEPSFDCWINDKGIVCGKCYSCDDKDGIKRFFKDQGYNQGTKLSPEPRRIKPAACSIDDDYEIYSPITDKDLDKMKQQLQHKFPGAALYVYMGTAQTPFCITVRTQDKQFKPHVLLKNKKTGHIKTKNKGPLDPKPLFVKPDNYRKDLIKTIHIYEGEKTTIAGSELYPDAHIIHICWGFGANTYKQADWKSLSAYPGVSEVILFPDNDEPGYKAMLEIAKRLDLLGYKTITWLDLKQFPPKWDIADLKTEIDNGIVMELYADRALVPLPIKIEYAYIKSTDLFYSYHDSNLYPAAHFSRVLKLPPKLLTTDGIIDSANKFLEAKSTKKVDKLTFDPTKKKEFKEGGLVIVNSYQPFKINPIEGDTSIIDKFFEYLIDEEVHRTWLKQWLAHNIQKPGVKIFSAPIIIGTQGIGKGIIFQMIRACVGNTYVKQAKASEIKSDFTEFVYRRTILCLDELKVNKNDKNPIMNWLKNIITEDELMINMKGLRPFWTKNVCNVCAFTNNRRAISVQPDDRRFWPYNITKPPMAKETYKQIVQMIYQSPGMLYKYFADISLAGFDKFAPPPRTNFFDTNVQETGTPQAQILNDYWEQRLYPFHHECNYVSPAHLVPAFNDTKLGLKQSFSSRDITDWLSSKCSTKPIQIHWSDKSKPTIWLIDGQLELAPLRPRDIARVYMQPIWEYTSGPSHRNYEGQSYARAYITQTQNWDTIPS